jgi:hypothetical protein
MIPEGRLFLFAGLLSSILFGLAGKAEAQIVALWASNVAGRGVTSSEAFPADKLFRSKPAEIRRNHTSLDSTGMSR